MAKVESISQKFEDTSVLFDTILDLILKRLSMGFTPVKYMDDITIPVDNLVEWNDLEISLRKKATRLTFVIIKRGNKLSVF